MRYRLTPMDSQTRRHLETLGNGLEPGQSFVDDGWAVFLDNVPARRIDALLSAAGIAQLVEVDPEG